MCLSLNTCSCTASGMWDDLERGSVVHSMLHTQALAWELGLHPGSAAYQLVT